MILVLQFRRDKTGWHEAKCFYQVLKIPYHQINFLNLFSDFINKDVLSLFLKKTKGIIIAGLGEYSHEEKDSKKRKEFFKIKEKTKSFLKEILKRRKPVLGICFGHQILGEFLGGKLDFAFEQREAGIKKIFLTKQGQRDPLFFGFQKSFFAVEGHKDALLTLPPKTIHLAFNKTCPIQAFRYRDNVYGLQFHPELDYQELIFRLDFYKSYKKKGEKIKKIKVRTEKIFENFLKICS
ncbi:MAG: glutamine amidotransferase-related protein [Minisyncoccales bacterium]